MNNIIEFQVSNSKAKYFLGIKTYYREYKRKYVFDATADYDNCYFINDNTVVSLFGIPIYKQIRTNDVINHFIFGFNIKKESFAEIYYKRNFKQIDIDYDDAYIMQGGSGEPFQWIAYAAKAHFDRNNSKKPLVILQRSNFAEFMKMYLPDVQYKIKKIVGGFDTEKSYMECRNHRYYINHGCRNLAGYCSLNSSILQDVYYVYKELALQGIKKSNLIFPKPNIPNHIKEELIHKIHRINLNIDNFVILAPEANTYFMPPVEFWYKVVQKFKNLGIDVFLNYINESNYISGCKVLHEPLTYSEIFELECKAKAVISLRSGFTETVLPSKTPVIAIMTLGVLPLSPLLGKASANPENPMLHIPFVKKGDLYTVWYFDYNTCEEASEAVLSSFNEIVKYKRDPLKEEK